MKHSAIIFNSLLKIFTNINRGQKGNLPSALSLPSKDGVGGGPVGPPWQRGNKRG